MRRGRRRMWSRIARELDIRRPGRHSPVPNRRTTLRATHDRLGPRTSPGGTSRPHSRTLHAHPNRCARPASSGKLLRLGRAGRHLSRSRPQRHDLRGMTWAARPARHDLGGPTSAARPARHDLRGTWRPTPATTGGSAPGSGGSRPPLVRSSARRPPGRNASARQRACTRHRAIRPGARSRAPRTGGPVRRR